MNTVETAPNPSSIILQQLGGHRFCVMTGAKDFVRTANSLSFRIGRNSGSVSRVRIVLDPSDTYTVSFLRVRGSKVTVVREVSDVYANSLQELFTRVTGMYTRL